MRNAARLLVPIATIVIPAVFAQTTSAKQWYYPDDAKAILSQQAPTAYKRNGLPDGVISILTTYRKPGLRVHIPGGHGYWQFENVAKLSYGGKPFAVVGTATCFTQAGNEAGCVTPLVIYDEDGDGKFETPVGFNDRNPPFSFHLPKWLER